MEVMKNLKKFKAESKINFALKAYLANKSIQEDYEMTLCKLFQQLDKNGDGILSKEEII